MHADAFVITEIAEGLLSSPIVFLRRSKGCFEANVSQNQQNICLSLDLSGDLGAGYAASIFRDVSASYLAAYGYKFGDFR
jgi:hypothetical protein